MLAEFFQIGPLPSNQLFGTYNWQLVLLSYIVATVASYIALDITGHLRAVNSSKTQSMLWLCGGAFAMGAGIWSMHFIGMLAFSMPGMAMGYELIWTSISLLVAILASGFALYLLKNRKLKFMHLAIGGVIMGLGIASMHYLGMEAMKQHVNIHYLPNLFILSIVIAIIASEAALSLAIHSTKVTAEKRLRLKVFSALIMGAAICGMHYTGMFAAIFTPNHTMEAMINIDNGMLAVNIAALTFIILGIAFFVSIYNETLNQHLLVSARQAGMADVASSVLHNVGNILTSVNVSVNLIAEKITHSKLSKLQTLNELVQKNKNNLGEFFEKDPRAAQLPEYIRVLATYWQEEEKEITHEIETLLKNVGHIKNIISTQQNLSKVKGLEQIVSIERILEESILICGLNDNQDGITLIKAIDSLSHPVTLDKIKLIQILVTLLRNAKESVIVSRIPKKTIVIRVMKSSNPLFFIVEIKDNGVGIDPNNLSRIFAQGFTKSNHTTYGLHASALAVKAMNGEIRAKSEGYDKGAIFTLELPYKQK